MKEELISVGIDIGTSTTQLVFSKLTVKNMSAGFQLPRVVISDKKIIYRSHIYFTPLISQNEIDGEKIKEILEEEYRKSGIKKEEIQTGAVIITGETARKENAREILNALSGFAGDFVVATAGPDLEGMIAGKGAGAHTYSKEHRTGVVNIDIGGGTSNLSLFIKGEIKETGCMDVGGRLIKVDKNTRRVTYIAPKIQEFIKDTNIDIKIGNAINKEALMPVISMMVKALEQSVGIEPRGQYHDLLITNKSLELTHPISCICFSGGVADYIYRDVPAKDKFEYGDIGILLGEAIKESKICKAFKVISSEETIRATVVGAGSHTMQISGSTITYTQKDFPLKNIPVLKISKDEEEDTAQNMQRAITEKLCWFETEDGFESVALGLEGEKSPGFFLVQKYAEGIVLGMAPIIQKNIPLIVIVENDMAKALGQAIYAIASHKDKLICVDGVRVENGDYVDIGSPIAQGKVLPMVIKTLVFS